MSTKERLAKELRENNAPDWMVKNAENGQYDDFESSSPVPIMTLVTDCQANGLHDIANRTMEGEFDASKEEAEAWARENADLIKSLDVQ